MKKIIFTIFALLFITASVYSYGFKIEDKIEKITEVNPALYLDIGTTLQVLIDNEGTSDAYIRTLKVTYLDRLDKPIKFQNGNKLYNRCSYESQIVLYANQDSLILNSWKRMSCEIVAFFNLTEEDIQWLKTNEFKEIRIINVTTNMNKVYRNYQPDYLKNLVILYNKKSIK